MFLRALVKTKAINTELDLEEKKKLNHNVMSIFKSFQNQWKM